MPMVESALTVSIAVPRLLTLQKWLVALAYTGLP